MAFKAEELTTRIVSGGGLRPCPDDTQRTNRGDEPCPDNTQRDPGDTQLPPPPTGENQPGDASTPTKSYTSSPSDLAMLREEMRERLTQDPSATRP